MTIYRRYFPLLQRNSLNIGWKSVSDRNSREKRNTHFIIITQHKRAKDVKGPGLLCYMYIYRLISNYLTCDIDDLSCWQPLANLASNTALTSTILLSVLPLPAVAYGGPPWKRRLQRGDALVQGAQKHESPSFVNQVAHSGTRFAPVIPWNIYNLYKLYIFVTYSLPPLIDQSIGVSNHNLLNDSWKLKFRWAGEVFWMLEQVVRIFTIAF